MPERLLQADDARLHVRDVGSGQPILVIHGGPDLDHEYFLPEMDGLADLGRLVYYDQRGRGRSFSGEGPDDVTLEGEMADLDRVRAWTGPEAVVLIGHSWGALLAMEYATRHPGRVSHLILLNPAPATHADMVELRRHLHDVRSPAQRQRRSELAADPAFVAGDIATEAEYYRIHFSAGVRRPEVLDEIVGRLRRGFTPEGLVAARAIEERLYELTWQRPDYDLLPRLAALDVPSLVLHGDRDLIPVPMARRIAEAIPGSRFVVLHDCGHFSFVEHPDAVHAAVADLIA